MLAQYRKFQKQKYLSDPLYQAVICVGSFVHTWQAFKPRVLGNSVGTYKAASQQSDQCTVAQYGGTGTPLSVIYSTLFSKQGLKGWSE